MVLLPSGENVEEEEDVVGDDDRVLGNGTSSSIAFHGNSSSQGNCWKVCLINALNMHLISVSFVFFVMTLQ